MKPFLQNDIKKNRARLSAARTAGRNNLIKNIYIYKLFFRPFELFVDNHKDLTPHSAVNIMKKKKLEGKKGRVFE